MNSLELHRKYRGKLLVLSKVPLDSKEDLSVFYTPGVAEPCLEIAKNPEAVYGYTIKGNAIAVVTDGSAVLGLGNIGPEAGMPVMEGKCGLFKRFAGIDAWPICLNVHSVEEIVATVKAISPGFGGINLEDIAAPQCFEIERRLQTELDLPVFHDDQHGTAIVVLAGLLNALKIVLKKLPDVRIVMSGAGAAGLAIADLLLFAGARDIVLCDRGGALSQSRVDLNSAKSVISERTNPRNFSGSLTDAMRGADVFIGVSSAGLVRPEMVAAMAPRAIVFALANPDPEIMPEDALVAGAYIAASGRSDLPNQLNNALIFPGIFRGALDHRVRKFTNEMFVNAARALAGLVGDPVPEKIIPDIFDERVVPTIAEQIF